MEMNRIILDSQLAHVLPEDREYYEMKRMLLQIEGRETLAVYEDPDSYIEVYYEPMHKGMLTMLRVPKGLATFIKPEPRGSFQLEKKITHNIPLSSHSEIRHILTRVIEKTNMEQIFRCSLDKKRVYDWKLPEREVGKLVLQDLYAVFLELLKTDDELMVLNLDACDTFISADDVFERDMELTFINVFAKFNAERSYGDPVHYISFGNKTLVELTGEFKQLPINNEQMIIDLRPFWYNSTELLFSTVCDIYIKIMLAMYKAIRENTVGGTVAIAKPSYSTGYVIQTIREGLIEPHTSDIIAYNIVSENDEELVIDCLISELSSVCVDVDRYTISKETGSYSSKRKFAKTVAEYDEYYYENEDECSERAWFYSEPASLLLIQELQEINEGPRKNELYEVDSDVWKEILAKYKDIELKHNKHYGYPERDTK